MGKEIKVFVIPVNDKGSDDYTNEDFINIAEQNGTIYSLKGFQNTFNYEESISLDSYIRIIKN